MMVNDGMYILNLKILMDGIELLYMLSFLPVGVKVQLYMLRNILSYNCVKFDGMKQNVEIYQKTHM